MKARKATSQEVKMHFLLADAFKEVVERGNIQFYPSKAHFQDKYERLLRKYQAYSEKELDRMIGRKDEVRLARYNSLDWHFGTVALSDISPWPEMDGLDIRLTTGNLPETVERFRKAFINKPEMIPDSFMPKIQSILYYDSLILPIFPIILFPGGLERGSHNNWVRASGEVKRGQQKDWICEISKYDNDAGNARAFAYGLAHIEEVNAYFGKVPRYK